MQQILLLKALFHGRLFYCLFVGCLFSVNAYASPLCPTNHIDEQVTVRYVHDGDTLHLRNGDKIRLIGINTPEVARKSHPAEPFANQARDRLRQLIKNNHHQLGLRMDAEHFDRYGRRLAHLYAQDGSSISAQLLQDGLATLLAVPPNLNGLDCYANTEAQAQQAGKGIWQLPRYRVISSSALPRNSRGYRHVSGKVIRIGEGRRNLWLNLPNKVAFRIEKKELSLFNTIKPRELLGKTIIGRGWLYEHKGELRMRLRSDFALQLSP